MSQTVQACLWMTGAIVSFTSMAIAGRAVAIDLDTFELMMYRSFFGIAVVLVIGGLAGSLRQITTRHMGLHVIRNCSHFAGQNLWFYAITVLPLTQVFALEFSLPLWVLLLSPIVLGEKLTWPRVGAAGVGFIGILIVTRPGAAPFDPNLIFAALAALGFAGSAVFTRRLTRTESITCVLFWLTVMQAVLGVGFSAWDGDVAWPSAEIWPWVMVVSVAGLVAHFCLTKALSMAPATVVMPVDFARLPVIAVVGALVYGEAIDPIVLLGAVVIFGANYVNILYETRSTRGTVANS